VSLSEIISNMEQDESIKFTREFIAIRCVLQKGEEQATRREVSIMVDPQEVELRHFDVLALEVNRAFTAIRKRLG
jgi:hypothetical protein